MMEAERRKAKRVEFRQPIQYRSRESEQLQGSLGYDLSEGGLRLQTESFIPLKKPLSIHMELGSGQSVEMDGHVVWVQLVPHAERYHVGLSFEDVKAVADPNTNSKKIIHQYIKSRQI